MLRKPEIGGSTPPLAILFNKNIYKISIINLDMKKRRCLKDKFVRLYNNVALKFFSYWPTEFFFIYVFIKILDGGE